MWKATMELRWYTYNVREVLQQKWVEVETGEAEWRDVPRSY